MPKAYLSLGSNIGDRYHYIQTAKQELKKHLSILNESSIYESEPWGEKNQNWFLNQCIEIETQLDPHKLYTLIEQIEKKLDKEKTTKFGPRTIDIDILFYANQIIKPSISNIKYPLTIPHPRLSKRQFVLTPLSEIAPNLIHPLDNKTIIELQSECTDKSEVKVWIPETSEYSQIS